jgi:hypothetical protein
MAVGGAVAVVAPFLQWYEAPVVDLTGWEALERVDVLLFVTGIAALAVVALTAQQRTAAAPIAAQALFTVFAGVVAIAVWARVLSVPDDLSRELGAWVALADMPVLVGGAMLAMRDERLSRGDRLTDSSGRPVESQPEIEQVPAPPAR